MVGRVEMKVVAPSFKDMDVLDAVTSRAADIIYADYLQGGPSVAGNTAERCMTLLLYVDDETPDAWLPQLKVLCAAVKGPIESVSIGQFVDDAE
jgi:hypothetical protein